MKNLLIIGYGKWGKKIFNYFNSTNFFNNIYIKRLTKNYTYCKKKKKLIEIDGNVVPKNIDFVHICSPTKTHYSLFKKFKKAKNLSVEKPLFDKENQYSFFKDQDSIKVNYIDLYNPITNFFFSDLKFNETQKIYLNYSNRENFFKKQIDFLNDWLDHPLSILLQMPRIDKIEKVESAIKLNRKKKFNYIFVRLKIKKTFIDISINKTLKKKREFIVLKKNKNIKYDLLKNKILINNKLNTKFNYSAFDNFFFKTNHLKTNIKFKKIKFHKKIFKFKKDLINLINR
tara:strand:+ start:112 stop:969 length:858 start_codon:yes stop_codon:yes gene_type:complete